MKIFVAVWAAVGVLLTGAVAMAQPAKSTIVLVHGAFANSSSCSSAWFFAVRAVAPKF